MVDYYSLLLEVLPLVVAIVTALSPVFLYLLRLYLRSRSIQILFKYDYESKNTYMIIRNLSDKRVLIDKMFFSKTYLIEHLIAIEEIVDKNLHAVIDAGKTRKLELTEEYFEKIFVETVKKSGVKYAFTRFLLKRSLEKSIKDSDLLSETIEEYILKDRVRRLGFRIDLETSIGYLRTKWFKIGYKDGRWQQYGFLGNSPYYITKPKIPRTVSIYLFFVSLVLNITAISLYFEPNDAIVFPFFVLITCIITLLTIYLHAISGFKSRMWVLVCAIPPLFPVGLLLISLSANGLVIFSVLLGWVALYSYTTKWSGWNL